MGLRNRLKKTFSDKKSGENTPSGDSTPKVEVYKAGQEPKPKYRGKIDKKHHDKLHAFSFSDAWTRRKSNVSGTMSPGGTEAQSRRPSWMGSLRNKSVGGAASGSDRDSKSLRRKSVATQPRTTAVQETVSDKANSANAGSSRPRTANRDGAAHANGANANPNNLQLEKMAMNGGLDPSYEVPFSSEELERAFTKATLEAPDGVALQAKNDIVSVL